MFSLYFVHMFGRPRCKFVSSAFQNILVREVGVSLRILKITVAVRVVSREGLKASYFNKSMSVISVLNIALLCKTPLGT